MSLADSPARSRVYSPMDRPYPAPPAAAARGFFVQERWLLVAFQRRPNSWMAMRAPDDEAVRFTEALPSAARMADALAARAKLPSRAALR